MEKERKKLLTKEEELEVLQQTVEGMRFQVEETNKSNQELEDNIRLLRANVDLGREEANSQLEIHEKALLQLREENSANKASLANTVEMLKAQLRARNEELDTSQADCASARDAAVCCGVNWLARCC